MVSSSAWLEMMKVFLWMVERDGEGEGEVVLSDDPGDADTDNSWSQSSSRVKSASEKGSGM